jgi:hypothetical protein
MNPIARTVRRIAACSALACSAVVLPGAALAAPAAGSGAAQAAAVTRCRAASTEIWVGLPGDGTAGTIYYQLEFSNVGHRACTLYGYPGVVARHASGRWAGAPAVRRYARKEWVTLWPGQTAHAVLGVVEAGAVCRHPVPAPGLRVWAPGQTAGHSVPLAVQVCPHRPTMTVVPVRPLAGIPGYSYR